MGGRGYESRQSAKLRSHLSTSPHRRFFLPVASRLLIFGPFLLQPLETYRPKIVGQFYYLCSQTTFSSFVHTFYFICFHSPLLLHCIDTMVSIFRASIVSPVQSLLSRSPLRVPLQ